MNIGIAGPASLHILASFVRDGDHLPRGYEFPLTAYLARQMLLVGHDVELFTLDRTVSSPMVWVGDHLTIHIGRYREKHRARDFFKVERADLSEAMRHSQCDIIHAHWAYEFAIAALTSGRPSLVTFHDWAPAILRIMPDPYRFMRLLMSLYTLRKGQHFTATSPYIQDRLRLATGVEHPIVPNGLLDVLFSNEERRFNGASPLLLSINNGFGQRKNVHTLLKSFPSVRRSHPGAELWLIGSGFGEDGAAELWARERDLVTGVRFLGQVEHGEALKLLRRADVLVHPSLEESFGMTLIEAMSQGTPVVGGAKSGAVPWVLDYGRAGMLTDISKPGALADAILRLFADEAVWNELSRVGRRHAFERFRLSRIASRYGQEYERVIASAASES